MKAARTILRPDVAIVGGGPAGLTAAATVARRGVKDVVVLEREGQAGGIPRHSGHSGYGMRDLRRVLTGPSYARQLVDNCLSAGVTLLTDACVTGWGPDGSLEATTPSGLLAVHPQAVVLSTGARERPRAARRIAGDRCDGIYTTGHLQDLVHLRHHRVGTRAVIVGSELVSWSAVLTLREAGCQTVAMTTTADNVEVYRMFSFIGQRIVGIPVATRTRVRRIIGDRRVQAVELENLTTGHRHTLRCDTVVLTGDWIPDHELARSGNIEIDPATAGPLVDSALHTTTPNVYAAGNVIHPVDTADVAALDGRHVAQQLVATHHDPARLDAQVRIIAEPPLRWVTPGLVRPQGPPPPRKRLLAWTDQLVRYPRVLVTQNGQTIATRQLPWPAAPGRAFRIPWSILASVDPLVGPIHILLD